MNESLRVLDTRLTEIVSEFLDLNFYNNEKFGVQNFERVFDFERQIQGIDTIFEFNGKKYLCDEKCAVKYRNLQTFSLELSTLNKRGDLMEGWFVNPDLQTNAYMFIWIDRTKVDTSTENNLFSSNDISKLEFAIVTKQRLYEYLCSLGWTKENLMLKSDRIRLFGQNENMGSIFTNGLKFSYSEKLFEKPVNVLLPRSKYIELADFSTVIYN